MAGLIATALEDFLKVLENHNGRPFLPRLGDLKPGRPRMSKDSDSVSEEIQPVSTQIPA